MPLPEDLDQAMATGIWTVEQLRRAEQAARRLKFLFFWGHKGRSGSDVGPHVMSQWYGRTFHVDGVSYPTAEHFMMAEKARLFGDDATLRSILAARSPGAAKALGRQVAGFNEDLWSAHRLDIVTRGTVAKFQSSTGLRDYLVGTGGRVLVEASPTDRVWGIGLAATDDGASSPSKWRGQNLLGLALMRARAELLNQRRGTNPAE